MAPIVAATPTRETEGAYWFRCVLANGSVILMSVPK